MDETEIAALKAEIVRLNKIIGILIEQNEAQKVEIAISKITNGNTNIPVAVADFIKGNHETTLAFSKIAEGNTKSPVAFVNINEGNTESQVAIAKITNGNTNVPVAVANITKGNTEVFTFGGDPVTRLRKVLKKEGFNKVRHKAVINAAKLLLHFQSKGRGDYKELRKLTELSNFGLAKYIRSLKKRGLIERDGWQKFKLTAHATGLIEKAGCTG